MIHGSATRIGMAPPIKHKQLHGDSGDNARAGAEQVKAFRKAARELGGDESEERFQEALRTVAKVKPPPQSKRPRHA